MPKQLVTAIGLVVSLGVIALGVFLVALPLYVQAVSVDGQTATVANTNAIYQAQVDSLREQEEHLDEINSNVTTLRAQIPTSHQLDDVFEVVARAAERSGVAITSVVAGNQAPFVPRSAPTDLEELAPAPAPEATPAPTEGTDDATGTTTEPSTGGSEAATGRQQVDFVIQATAADMAQVTAFLDALRAGPRLLSSITATTAQSGEGPFDVRIGALTYVEVEG